MTEWHVIDVSAPRNGRKVDLWVVEQNYSPESHRVTDCYWGEYIERKPPYFHKEIGRRMCWLKDQDVHGSYEAVPVEEGPTTLNDGTVYSATATHWMYPPEPPE